MLTFERLPQETAREHALRTIKENIIRLELPPGSRVGEIELADKLGLTRMPVREALMELSRIKVVDIQPQRKGVVALIDLKLVEDAQFTRRVLECSVVELACSMATEKHMQGLEANIKYQQFSLENQMPDRLMEACDSFHSDLFAITEKNLSYDLMKAMSIHFDRVRSLSSYNIDGRQVVQDHIRIVEAVCRRDPAEAHKLMDEHLHHVQLDIDIVQNTYPHYFKH